MNTELHTVHDVLRHFLVSLAYRFRHVTDDAGADFADFDAGAGVRAPGDLVRHMSGLIRFAHASFEELAQEGLEPLDWEGERARFLARIAALDRLLEDGRSPVAGEGRLTLEQLWQGPLLDAMTHVGQLATLRRLAGAPVGRVRYWAVDMNAAPPE